MDKLKNLTMELTGIGVENHLFLDIFKPLKHTNGRIAKRFSMHYHKAFEVLEECVEKLKDYDFYFLIEMENGREVVAVETEHGLVILIVLSKQQAGQLIPITSLNPDQVVIHYDGTEHSIAKLIADIQ